MNRVCTFIGHSKIASTHEFEETITIAIENTINQGIHEFYCGGYGEFDLLCARILRKLKYKYDYIKIFFITPYINDGYKSRLTTIRDFGLYDEILYPELETIPMKFAISKRNEYMIDCAEVIIAHVVCEYGGAYRTLKYAHRKHKKVIYV